MMEMMLSEEGIRATLMELTAPVLDWSDFGLPSDRLVQPANRHLPGRHMWSPEGEEWRPHPAFSELRPDRPVDDWPGDAEKYEVLEGMGLVNGTPVLGSKEGMVVWEITEKGARVLGKQLVYPVVL